MTATKRRIAAAALLLAALVYAAVILASPTPSKQPGWTCGGCNSWNESSRTRCRNCGA